MLLKTVVFDALDHWHTWELGGLLDFGNEGVWQAVESEDLGLGLWDADGPGGGLLRVVFNLESGVDGPVELDGLGSLGTGHDDWRPDLDAFHVAGGDDWVDVGVDLDFRA